MVEFKVTALARILGVHRNTVTNWIRTGKLPATPAPAKRYRLSAAALKRFAEAINFPLKQLIDALKKPADLRLPASNDYPHLHTNTGEETMTDNPIGSVMVIGGGIAGIQASLDLANSGYHVHLIEKTAGIGGVMAQLDKTYPTNDCAM
jgi:excisionase family DNA binding protein